MLSLDSSSIFSQYISLEVLVWLVWSTYILHLRTFYHWVLFPLFSPQEPVYWEFCHAHFRDAVPHFRDAVPHFRDAVPHFRCHGNSWRFTPKLPRDLLTVYTEVATGSLDGLHRSCHGISWRFTPKLPRDLLTVYTEVATGSLDGLHRSCHNWSHYQLIACVVITGDYFSDHR